MNKRTALATLGLTLICPALAHAIQTAATTTVVSKINYLTFLPKSYSAKGEPVPMIIFLHGSGERGSDLEKVKKWGPPALAESNPNFPFLVISPQVPDGEAWHAASVKAVIDEVLAKYNVDRRRIYLTGISMGGYGAWDLATRYPDYFAAIAPICGGGNARAMRKLTGIPTWVFHGKKDEAVPESESAVLVAALQTAGGNVRYTVLPEGDHVASWVHAYDEKTGLFDWFLQQRKK